VATSASRMPRRQTLLLLAVIAVLVLGLGVTLVALMSGSAAPAGTAPAVSQPASSPSPSPGGQQQQQRYRAYVSTAVTHGTALAGATAGLQDCRTSRERCEQRIAEASEQVDQFQSALSVDSAPACLSVADQRLRDGLSFEGRGLGLAGQAMEARNRLKLAQGLLLVTVGAWREGQAIWAARQSDC